MFSETVRREVPLIFSLVMVGSILGGLLAGYEPVGGDPDRMYRPLKSELARCLSEGRLPFWSERFGLGVPLVAESHVAAFYPPNLVLYTALDVSTAYRLSMWLHYLALVAATYGYARCLGVTPWGSALAGVSFTLCGFQAIHSSHEPFYCLMPYLPLALSIAERYVASGRIAWLALLALCLGFQWTLGHFQIQTWTGVLVVLLGLWRAGCDGRPWSRAAGLIAATGWGAALVAVQLGLSWQFAGTVGQTGRPPGDLLYFAFPVEHWFELALPRVTRELQLGPDDPYWLGQQSSGYEAALYVGTIPLIFVFVGIFGRPGNRSTMPWRILVPLSFAMATMPHWWPQAYFSLLAVPGLGYFRVPARYTLLTSLGLALLAGEGFDHTISKTRFRLGVAASIVFGGYAALAAFLWARWPSVHLGPRLGGLPAGMLWAALAWFAAGLIVFGWRSRRLGAWAPLAVAAVELGILFYLGTTQWGWSIALPGQSTVLGELLRRPPSGLIGGQTENLPVRAGMGTGNPYLGFSHAHPNRALVLLQERLFRGDASTALDEPQAAVPRRLLRRLRVAYMVGFHRSVLGLGPELGRWRDPALDRIVPRGPTEPATRAWSIVQLDEPFPEARVAPRARTAAHRRALVERLSHFDDLDMAWFLAEDGIPARPDARSARLISWNGSVAEVEHDGPCDLVIARTFDPGWLSRINGGREHPVLPVDAGFQAVRIEGSGTDRVALRYRPPRINSWASTSLLAAALLIGALIAALVSSLRKGVRNRYVETVPDPFPRAGVPGPIRGRACRALSGWFPSASRRANR